MMSKNGRKYVENKLSTEVVGLMNERILETLTQKALEKREYYSRL